VHFDLFVRCPNADRQNQQGGQGEHEVTQHENAPE
jgi:hypothetical protein